MKYFLTTEIILIIQWTITYLGLILYLNEIKQSFTNLKVSYSTGDVITYNLDVVIKLLTFAFSNFYFKRQ